MKQRSIWYGGLLTIVFVFLKLTGFLEWAWIWVLSPVWIELIITGILFIVIYISRKKSIWTIPFVENKRRIRANV